MTAERDAAPRSAPAPPARRPPARVLLIDNYDSFTHNLAHLFGELGGLVEVVRNDDPSLEDDRRVVASDLVVIGPGPGRPAEAGRTFETMRAAIARGRTLFGVCLGLQAIGELFGGRVTYAPSLMHGKTSQIVHDGTGVFTGVPSPFEATRYHSLCVAREAFPDDALRINASSADGVVQGVAHRELPVHGVQFHPESVLTAAGRQIFENVLEIAVRRR